MTVRKTPTLYLQNRGVIPLTAGTRQDSFQKGVSREEKRKLPLKYQRVEETVTV